MDSIQTEVETHLSKATIISYQKEGEKIYININFEEKDMAAFLQPDMYIKVCDYFKDRNLILVIKQKGSIYRSSIVDKDNGDTINLSHVLWVKDELKNFKDSVMTCDELIMTICLLDMDSKSLIPHPLLATYKLPVIQGYSFDKTPWD